MEKENTSSPLPSKGLLQFFISDDDLMGVNYDDETNQNSFRIIYHENIDYSISKESVEQLGFPNSNKAEFFPANGEYKISLNKTKDYITYHDIKFDKIFAQAYKEVFGKKIKEGEKYYNVLIQNDVNLLNEELDSKTPFHKMLGYAFFTQEDAIYQKNMKIMILYYYKLIVKITILYGVI